MDNGTNSTNGTFEDSQSSTAPPKNFWTNLILPVAYLVILIGSLATFSSLYRKRQNAKAARLENWFPPHRQRDIYLSLLHLDPADASSGSSEKKLSQVPDSVYKAALLQRALEDIRRIVQLRTSKPALQALLQRGSVGDELWQRFQRAEKEIEEEVKDVVNEANAFTPGWGQIIFQSANEMNQNRIIKERVTELQAQAESEKSWWESKRAGIQTEFMKELDEEEATAAADDSKMADSEDAVLVESGGPTGSQGSKKKKSKK